jgi:class 3 adenylate cyclase/predicted ATPase
MACGAALGTACRRCGQELRIDALFCSACGHAVPGGSPTPRFAAAASYTPRHLADRIRTAQVSLEGERKQVTVLFADTKSSMELVADRDPEEVHRLLDPVLTLMMEAVHRYEGTVNQVMGDGIMALFGAPLAHEDHAVRACYAALRMQETVKRYAEGLPPAGPATVQIRIGLNSGEVVVGAIGSDLRMDYTAVGQTTHLAARMEQMAAPGTVLMTRDTLALVDGFVEVVPLGATRVRGLAEPIDIYELVGASRIRSRLQVVAARGLTPFVGRELEMEQMRRALALSGEGHGQVVAIVGEPGVGKSRLVHEFVRAPRERGWLVLEGSAVSVRGATPYQLFSDVLRTYLGVDAGAEAASVRERIAARVLALDADLEPTLPALLALLDVPLANESWDVLDPAQRRRRTLDALRRLFLRVSQGQPLLLVFEDVHWADSGTQAGLDLLVESIPAAQILLLLNHRPGYEPAWGRRSYVSQIRLDPLSAASMGDLIDVIVGRDASVAPLRPLLAARTEGNPLFLEESVRTLVETRALVGTAGQYALTRPVATVQVPPTVEAILAARIDLLAPEDKRLLQVASAIGRDVPLVILEAVADLPEAALHEGLARLQAAEFLHEARLFPDREYTFKHALTHEVAYHSLLRSLRRSYHHRIAQAVEARVPGIAETRPELLAHHWDEAGAHDKAVSLWQRAGRRAIERSAHAEAIRYITRALEVLETLPDTDERARRTIALHLFLTNSISATRGYTALGPVCARLRELAGRAGTDHLTALRLLVPQWMFHAASGPLPVAHALAEQGLALAEESGASGWILVSLLAVAHSLRAMGKFSAAVALAERGLRLYSPDEHSPHALRSDEDSGAYLMRDRAAALWALGYPDQALTQVREAIDHARGASHPYSLGRALASASRLHLLAGQPDPVRAMVEEGLLLARQYGFSLQIIWMEALRGWTRCAEGRLAEGIAGLEDAVASLRGASVVVGLPVALLALATALTAARRLPQALTVLDDATRLVADTGEHEHDAPLLRARGEALVQAADEVAAEEAFRAAIVAARGQAARSFELGAATGLARLLARQGKPIAARDLLAGVHGWFTEGFDTAELRSARALLDALA